MVRWKESMHNYKLCGLMMVLVAVTLGSIIYELSFVSIPTFSMSIDMMMLPMIPLGLATIILLIKEMKD